MFLYEDDTTFFYRRPDDLDLTGKGRFLGLIGLPVWLNNPLTRANLTDYVWLGEPAKQVLTREGAAALTVAASYLGAATRGDVVYRAVGNEQAVARGLESLRDYVEKGGRLDCVALALGEKKPEGTGWFEERNIPVFHREDFQDVNMPNGPREMACWNQEKTKRELSASYAHKGGDPGCIAPFAAGLFLLARETDSAFTRAAFFEILKKSAVQTNIFGKTPRPTVSLAVFIDCLRPNPPRQTLPPPRPLMLGSK